MQIKKSFFAVLAGISLLASCATSQQGRHSNPSELEGDWQVERLYERDITFTETTPHITFDLSKGQIYGNLSCNDFNASFSLDSAKQELSIGSVATTRMACEDMSTENSLAAALKEVHHFDVTTSGGVANLYAADGREVIRLKR